MNDIGILMHPNGDIYEGQWLDGQASGEGTYITTDGSKYVGQWKNDKQHGTGVDEWLVTNFMIIQNGSRYEGDY